MQTLLPAHLPVFRYFSPPDQGKTRARQVLGRGGGERGSPSHGTQRVAGGGSWRMAVESVALWLLFMAGAKVASRRRQHQQATYSPRLAAVTLTRHAHRSSSRGYYVLPLTPPSCHTVMRKHHTEQG
ncbi:hypothetical protein E2C01_001096 [Portunus trituberculatus]|uniref:Uncharacterized protein n=1 Tax=Portunus trituberculatus TaxID=210409 RepID=A0A5B7CG26_PORTR|nr:hypothetical protein [Portunus trituberculatus]